jgi:hypothetical protein
MAIWHRKINDEKHYDKEQAEKQKHAANKRRKKSGRAERSVRNRQNRKPTIRKSM